ncbi:MAG: DNA-directed RNA polymerase subunit A', partial [Candidatus Aenigmarchaeota archaeon]|nr:DNA-directed RNA polymerase subunit A' [Candidatus Aenigmarchaeota archaeon]
LMVVENNIRSPRYGIPIIACKHDHITGAYLLTADGTKLARREATEILNAMGIEEFAIKDEYTGKEIFSHILPKGLNVAYTDAAGNEVEIKDGFLKKGIIDENGLGEKKGMLIDVIDKQYGHAAARDFIDMVSRLALEVVSRRGFTISSSDEDISAKSRKRIEEIVQEYEDTTKMLVRDYEKGHGDKKSGMGIKMVLENKILQLGGDASNKASDVIKKELPMNSSVIMAVSGARGSYVNLTQMCAFVGQEALEGERIFRGFLGRTLPHFPRGDLGLKSHGFVSHGYKEGLDPFEFFFDAMNSRENLMDKSLHTRHSGYMERRLVNALQDLRVEYDGTVRNSRGQIIQFNAGCDGIDPSKSDSGTIDFGRL